MKRFDPLRRSIMISAAQLNNIYKKPSSRGVSPRLVARFTSNVGSIAKPLRQTDPWREARVAAVVRKDAAHGE
ncbi:MAG: hypothetical protein AAGM38_07870 [Pseudomonadota bacterium]